MGPSWRLFHLAGGGAAPCSVPSLQMTLTTCRLERDSGGMAPSTGHPQKQAASVPQGVGSDLGESCRRKSPGCGQRSGRSLLEEIPRVWAVIWEIPVGGNPQGVGSDLGDPYRRKSPGCGQRSGRSCRRKSPGCGQRSRRSCRRRFSASQGCSVSPSKWDVKSLIFLLCFILHWFKVNQLLASQVSFL